jgi:hypothetical protein
MLSSTHHHVVPHRDWRRNDPAAAADAIRRAAPPAPILAPHPSADPTLVPDPTSPTRFRSELNALAVEMAQDSYTVDPYGVGGHGLTPARTRKVWKLLQKLSAISQPGQGLLQTMLETLYPAVFTQDTNVDGEPIPHFALVSDADTKVLKERSQHEVHAQLRRAAPRSPALTASRPSHRRASRRPRVARAPTSARRSSGCASARSSRRTSL